MKKAIITGISGQDGSYLAELLLEKGYEVWSAEAAKVNDDRRHWRIAGIIDKLSLHGCDKTNSEQVEALFFL